LPIYDWWVEFDGKVVEQRRIKEISGGKTGKDGGFSKAQWDKARKEHREKMNDRT